MADRITSAGQAPAPSQLVETATSSNAYDATTQGQPLVDDEELEADDNDSAYEGSVLSDTTSVKSEIYRGYVENGRRYQTVAENKFYGPSDEKQFDSMNAGHLTWTVLESQQENPLFRSAISQSAQHILDLGTGDGSWALEVADRFPNATVTGIDLYPPPVQWTAPNAVFQVDDMNKEWTYSQKFDLIHLRFVLGSCTDEEWNTLYQRAYDALAPGGYIEHFEPDINCHSLNNSMPADSIVANWGKTFERASEKHGNRCKVAPYIEERIKAAGFTNVQRRDYKVPIGGWPKHKIYRDAGRMNAVQIKSGSDGWALFLLTKYGEPTPWSREEVTVYIAKMLQEIDQPWQLYQEATRVWAQKPLDSQPKADLKVEVEHLASGSDGESKPGTKQ